jgi:hypothetical protein
MCARKRDRPARCTASERRRRIAEVQDAAALGEDLTAAARRLCGGWGVSSRRNAARYARAALGSWSRDRLTSARAALDAAIATRRQLYRMCIAGSDFGAAVRALDGLEKLLGVDPPTDMTAIRSGVDEVMRIIREECDRATARRIGLKIEAVMGDEPEPLPAAPVNRAFPTNGTR